MLLSPASWTRSGKGHRLDFYITSAELVECLTAGMPEEFEPYEVVGENAVRRSSGYERVAFRFPVRELPSRMGPEGAGHQGFLRSRRLTPDLERPDDRDLESCLSLSGAIQILHGLRRGTSLEPSSIAVVSSVRSLETGEERRHDAYEGIYQEVRKRINKLLVLNAVIRFPDGHEERARQVRFSEAMAALCDSGVEMVMRPRR